MDVEIELEVNVAVVIVCEVTVGVADVCEVIVAVVIDSVVLVDDTDVVDIVVVDCVVLVDVVSVCDVAVLVVVHALFPLHVSGQKDRTNSIKGQSSTASAQLSNRNPNTAAACTKPLSLFACPHPVVDELVAVVVPVIVVVDV